MRKKAIGQAVFILLYILVGIFFILYASPVISLLTKTGRSAADNLLNLTAVLFLLVFSVLFHLIIHEAGHLVFGLLSGYRFASFRVGSLMLIKQNGQYIFRRFSLPGTGGQCLLIPPDLQNGQIPFVLYFLGGVLFNFSAALIFWMLYHMAVDWPFLSLLFLFLTVFGLFFAFSNGIPLRMKMVENDGYHVLHLHKDKQAMRCLWLQMKVNAQLTNGQRLKDMPDDWFILPSRIALKNSLCAAVGMLVCNRAMDQQEFAAADRIARDLLEQETGLNGLHRSLLIAERIFCALISQKETDMLDQMNDKAFQAFLKSMSSYPAVIRMQYAYALLHSRDPAAAARWLAAFAKVAAHYPYASEIEGEQELLDVVQKQAAQDTVQSI